MKMCRQLSRIESYMTVQHANLAISFDQEIIASRHGLLSRRFVCIQILCSESKNVIVIDVHSLRRFLLVLAWPVVITLIVIQLVGLWTGTLTCGSHVVWTLCWSTNACASVDGQRGRTRISIESENFVNENENLSNFPQKPQPKFTTRENKELQSLPPMMKAAWTEAADRRRLQFVTQNRAVLAVQR